MAKLNTLSHTAAGLAVPVLERMRRTGAYGFKGFSPFTRPCVIAVAEAIPFVELSDYYIAKLYELKGEIVSRGIARHRDEDACVRQTPLPAWRNALLTLCMRNCRSAKIRYRKQFRRSICEYSSRLRFYPSCCLERDRRDYRPPAGALSSRSLAALRVLRRRRMRGY